MPTPLTQEQIKAVNTVFNALLEPMGYLWSRWQDEREYEDIKDYQTAIEAKIAEALPNRISIVKMTKRPFGFQFKIDNSDLFKMTCTSRNMAWGRC